MSEGGILKKCIGKGLGIERKRIRGCVGRGLGGGWSVYESLSGWDDFRVLDTSRFFYKKRRRKAGILVSDRVSRQTLTFLSEDQD